MFAYNKRECSICHTSNIGGSNIQFLFSTCCGAIVCDPCRTNLKIKNNNLNCPECNILLGKDAFDIIDYDAQKYKKELEVRLKIEKIFNFTSSDFQSKFEYDNYLELKQDITYDLVYGDLIAKNNADKRMKEFSTNNKDAISKNANRILSESIPENIVAMDISTTTSSSNVNRELYRILPFETIAGLLPTVSDEERRRKEKTEAAKLCGGFVYEDIKKRCEAEALSSLWIL